MIILPSVNIWMITYNHERYIRDAIDGILKQRTTFPFSLIIGEDGSTDETRRICEEYALKFPTKVYLLPFDGNKGMEGNMIETLKACKEKYIAFCEGDDYWTDEFKLQKQIDFLETNTDFTACFHNVEINSSKGEYLNRVYPEGRKAEINLLDLADGDYMKTCALVARNSEGVFSPIFDKLLPAEDTSLGFCLLKNNTKAKYFSDVMSVYRIHEAGIWSQLTEVAKVKWSIRNLIIYNKYFNKHLIALKFKKQLKNEAVSLLKMSLKNFNVSDTFYAFSIFIKNEYF